jgi:hypothetical protein
MTQISFLKVHLLTVIAVCVAFISLSRRAEAAVVTSGCVSVSQCTLQELFDGGSITVGRLVFSDFAFLDGERDPGGPPQATQMIVTGLGDGGANPGQGLSYDFDNELSLASGGDQVMTFRFAFSVSDLLSQAVITGHMLNMAAFINAGNPGTFEGQLNVRDTLETSMAIGLGNAFVESVILASAGVNVLNNPDQITFAPQSAVRVSTVVNAMTTDQIELGVLEQRFSTVVPELDTFVLIAGGLAFLLVVRTSRRRRFIQ